MTIGVIRLASEANIDLELHVSIGREPVWIATQDELERFTAMVVEECAKVVSETVEWKSKGWTSTICPITKGAIAAAIRARKPA